MALKHPPCPDYGRSKDKKLSELELPVALYIPSPPPVAHWRREF